MRVEPRFTFDTLVVGGGNRLAVAAASPEVRRILASRRLP